MKITSKQVSAVLSWLLRNHDKFQTMLDDEDRVPAAVLPDPVITHTPIEGLYTHE
jgi:hypothetical protein